MNTTGMKAKRMTRAERARTSMKDPTIDEATHCTDNYSPETLGIHCGPKIWGLTLSCHSSAVQSLCHVIFPVLCKEGPKYRKLISHQNNFTILGPYGPSSRFHTVLFPLIGCFGWFGLTLTWSGLVWFAGLFVCWLIGWFAGSWSVGLSLGLLVCPLVG